MNRFQLTWAQCVALDDRPPLESHPNGPDLPSGCCSRSHAEDALNNRGIFFENILKIDSFEMEAPGMIVILNIRKPH
jgi:hypothetical protein